LEDTVSLELIRRKDGSIVSISKISEVIVSSYSSLMLWNLQLYNNILWPLLHIFRGSEPPTPRIYAPAPTWQTDRRIQGDSKNRAYALRPVVKPNCRSEVHMLSLYLFKKYQIKNLTKH